MSWRRDTRKLLQIWKIPLVALNWYRAERAEARCDWARVIAEIEAIHRRLPGNDSSFLMLGRAHLALGQGAEALRRWRGQKASSREMSWPSRRCIGGGL